MRHETDEQFDDGGTPMWRANQATYPSPPYARPPRKRWFWQRWTLVNWLLAAVALGFGLPMFILVFGLLGVYAFDRMTGN